MSEQKMKRRDKITLGLMVAMSFFLMCDLFITPALVTDLSIEYTVPKEALGWVGSAFILVGAFISIYFGYMADKISRKHLLVATVLIGEIPCLLTGIHFFTSTFTGFLVLRTLTGIGIGGVFPITFSLVSDYFSDKHRAKASAFIDIAWGLGAMVGPVLAGLALETNYGWRLAFIIAAVPNFPLALLFAVYATNPPRGGTESALAKVLNEGAEYVHRIKLSDFRIVFKNRTNLLLFLQGIPGCIPWGLLPFWIITFFREVESLTHGNATMVWELFGIGSAIGAISWALLGDWLFKKDPRYLPLFCTIGVFLGTIPCFIVMNVAVTSLGFHFVMAIMGGILISVPASNNKAMLMNINRPEHRGSVFAVFNITDSLGKGVGPAVGSILLAVTGSYHFMMNFAISSWLLCGLIFIGVIFTITKDRDSLLQLMEKRAEALTKSKTA
ncbi:MFS transporter [bacterium]|nr:MFS transporter [bacterium]